MGKRDRKSPYLHHQAPLSRYGAFGGCNKAGRAGSPARPYIRNIRKKLRLDCITTVKGIGYKFEMGQEI